MGLCVSLHCVIAENAKPFVSSPSKQKHSHKNCISFFRVLFRNELSNMFCTGMKNAESKFSFGLFQTREARLFYLGSIELKSHSSSCILCFACVPQLYVYCLPCCSYAACCVYYCILPFFSLGSKLTLLHPHGRSWNSPTPDCSHYGQAGDAGSVHQWGRG